MNIQILSPFSINSNNAGVSTGSRWLKSTGDVVHSYSPVDGNMIASVMGADAQTYEQVIEESKKAFLYWRQVATPKRGEVIRQIGEAFRLNKEALGKLISYETGKSLQEGYGEVQEIIDVCDFAVGLSRQPFGGVMHSERGDHRMMEQWHPLGVVGIISAFNFPAAVWGWNVILAWVCGDVCIWKPSEKTPITAVACQKIVAEVFTRNNLPEGISCLVTGGREIGEVLVRDKNIPLISATGSTAMGRKVGEIVASRFGRSILELGGNNAMIISEKADFKMAVQACAFSAIGTAGQRCTTTRRVIVHESIYDAFKDKLTAIYNQIKIGSPLNENNHMGPLIDKDAVGYYNSALREIKNQGGSFIVDGEVLEGEGYESGCYVKPCIAAVENHWPIVQHETFVPILYLMKYTTLEEAVCLQNSVPQGLSSSIMTLDMREAEYFLSLKGSDCGIANVNLGTSGAEIGGAFGGEKETGGGRECGSDSWKNYMRRQTNVINYSTEFVLAQGIKFDL